MTVTVHSAECAAAGVDSAEVLKIAKGLARYVKQAAALGLIVFSDGSLRYADGGNGALLVAEGLGRNMDGGDGACSIGADGLLRGEV